MTVLHVLDHSAPILSGYSSRSRSIVTFQQRLGLRPVVVTSTRQGTGGGLREEHDGIPYYRTSAPATGWRSRFALVRETFSMHSLSRRIAEIARHEAATLLHAHSPLLNGFPTLLVGRRLGLPVVYEARAFWEDAAVDHGTARAGSARYRLTRFLETWLFRHADCTVTICEGMRRDIIRRGIDPERVAVVPNGVDVDWFQPRPRNDLLARRLGLGGGPVFGFIGSFYRYEGLRLMVEAMQRLRTELPGAQLLLVGGGAEKQELRAFAAGLGDTVVFAGQVPHAQIRDYYSVIDIFVCPRRRSRLTELVTPLKPLEAMAMSHPVLASDVGGLAELIRPEDTGLLFRAERLESLVAEAARLGQDEALRHRLGTAARKHTERERSWASIASRYLPIYDSLAKGDTVRRKSCASSS